MFLVTFIFLDLQTSDRGNVSWVLEVLATFNDCEVGATLLYGIHAYGRIMVTTGSFFSQFSSH